MDLYHAREHVWSVRQALYPDDERERKHWVGSRIEQLDRGDIPALLKTFDAAPVPYAKAGEALRKEREYLNKNRARMQYRKFKAQGLFLRSGVIEAGCKSVIGHRLKQSGMRWTVRGANAIMALAGGGRTLLGRLSRKKGRRLTHFTLFYVAPPGFLRLVFGVISCQHLITCKVK